MFVIYCIYFLSSAGFHRTLNYTDWMINNIYLHQRAYVLSSICWFVCFEKCCWWLNAKCITLEADKEVVPGKHGKRSWTRKWM